jgi:hypothetical protein
MIQLTALFIVSQSARFLAILLDFFSLQLKKRQHIFLVLIFSASLISLHYFFLGLLTAGALVLISVLRFIVCYFTTDKRWLILFILLPTISLYFTYNNPYDIVIYAGLIIFIFGNFQKNDKPMRQLMMLGTGIITIYNIVVFSPMGIIGEGTFFLSGVIAYYRYYIKGRGWPFWVDLFFV